MRRDDMVTLLIWFCCVYMFTIGMCGCGVPPAGECAALPDGNICGDVVEANGATDGTCRGGVCCKGCWLDGVCVDGGEADACGRRGATCELCATKYRVACLPDHSGCEAH